MENQIDNSQSVKCCPKILKNIFAILALLLVIGAVVAVVTFLPKIVPQSLKNILPKSQISQINSKVEKFKSDEEFKQYLQNSQNIGFGSMGMGTTNLMMAESRAEKAMAQAPVVDMAYDINQIPADRFSQTNVQVAGIDEPDIVKTDGNNIFYSGNNPLVRYMEIMPAPAVDRKMVAPSETYPQYNYGQTRIISAFPPDNLKQIGNINYSGEILLADKILVVLSSDSRQILGYDISNPESPVQKWNLDLSDGTEIKTARLKDGKLYLITNTYVYNDTPCPIRPLKSLELICTDIYHPVTPSQSDTTFTAMEINPQTGEIDQKIAFIGSMSSSTVYMSDQNLYITNSFQGDMLNFIYRFFTESPTSLIPQNILDKLAKLKNYDLSTQAKMVEMESIFQSLYQGKTDEERLQFENDINNGLAKFSTDNLREFEQTGITKINLANFSITANGSVAGHPLNQFSLDEFENNLRIATNIAANGILGFANRDISVNDVNILDKNLNLSGSITDLGTGEQIYAVRFLADKGYVVTFKQTDPLYVLDLSSAKNPQKVGELKIPGYSAYLHPIDDNLLLGIGKEGSQVKISLFDVANPKIPKELDTYQLKDYWTEIEQNHRAFLLDSKNQIFFMPGGQGGYVFSYVNNKFVLKKAIANLQVKRAVFINNYLYVIGEGGIVVLNEADWTQVNKLDFETIVSSSLPTESIITPSNSNSQEQSKPSSNQDGFNPDNVVDYIGL